MPLTKQQKDIPKFGKALGKCHAALGLKGFVPPSEGTVLRACIDAKLAGKKWK